MHSTQSSQAAKSYKDNNRMPYRKQHQQRNRRCNHAVGMNSSPVNVENRKMITPLRSFAALLLCVECILAPPERLQILGCGQSPAYFGDVDHLFR
jgi:hypothetical protein